MSESPTPTITAQLAKMTAGDYQDEDYATGIVQAHRVYKFLGSEGAVERVARWLCKVDSFGGDPDELFVGAPLWMQFEDVARAILSKIDRVAKGDGA